MIYSTYDVYPSDIDDIDTSMCENCNYDCWEAGRCLMEDPE